MWAGVGLVRGGAGTALVGSHEQVADRIEEYAELGIDEFVLSGYPHLEDAYWFGEGVLPILAERGRWAAPRSPAAYVDRGAVRRPGQVVTSLRTAVLVGNPQPRSRTLAAATTVARRLTDAEPGLVVDLATVGPALLDWQDPSVAALVDELGAADLVVVASPTYKATYTGLLKLFLDRFAGGVGLRGVAVPLMLGAAPHHALAAELHLRPLLTELGAAVPAPRPVRPRPRARPSRGLRRLAGAGPPARDRLRHRTTGATA